MAKAGTGFTCCVWLGGRHAQWPKQTDGSRPFAAIRFGSISRFDDSVISDCVRRYRTTKSNPPSVLVHGNLRVRGDRLVSAGMASSHISVALASLTLIVCWILDGVLHIHVRIRRS